MRDKEHGLQFKGQVLKASPPTTSEGVERYLGGGFVKGVGPVLAKKRLRLEAIPSHADDGDVAEVGNQGDQPLPKDECVLHDKNPDWSRCRARLASRQIRLDSLAPTAWRTFGLARLAHSTAALLRCSINHAPNLGRAWSSR